jgi:hypothetical protein
MTPSIILALTLSPIVFFQAIASDNPVEAFNRIIPGWTNYSTAFNVTHDTGTAGDYATVGMSYTPATNVALCSFDAILIGGDTRAPDFGEFQYRVFVWSGLEQFIGEPRTGDVATVTFLTPTGGNTSVPDATTRHGRGAYRLGFSLTNAGIILTAEHPYWIGFAALGRTQSSGDLFVPTASDPGQSDVQAGDLVTGGWHYLVDAGGSTVYSGRLAVALLVVPQARPPALDIALHGSFVELTWPRAVGNFLLESTFDLSSTAEWLPVPTEPTEEDDRWKVTLPALAERQWFRLREENSLIEDPRIELLKPRPEIQRARKS